MISCTNCGEAIAVGTKFCRRCGAPAGAPAVPIPDQPTVPGPAPIPAATTAATTATTLHPVLSGCLTAGESVEMSLICKSGHVAVTQDRVLIMNVSESMGSGDNDWHLHILKRNSVGHVESGRGTDQGQAIFGLLLILAGAAGALFGGRHSPAGAILGAIAFVVGCIVLFFARKGALRIAGIGFPLKRGELKSAHAFVVALGGTFVR